MTRLLALIAAVALAPAAGAQMVEAPMYTNWSKFPPGTSITLRTVTESGGAPIESTTTQTLISVDAKQVLIEQAFHGDGPGGESEETTQELRIRRWFPLPAGMKEEDIGKPSDAVAQGEEALDVAGKTYTATWYDVEGQTEAGPSLTRSWISDEVPGQILKAVTRVEAADKTTTIELVEIAQP